MDFQSFEQALKVCLTAAPGSSEQDEALVYCMEHAPEDLKEMLRRKFIEFHQGRQEQGHEHGQACGCGGEKKQLKPSDFLK